jgi:hypothetical protein
VIIIGAGRSGTKLLRGILASHPQFVCFPREINYIWRYGNAFFPTDELDPDLARPKVVAYIRKCFNNFAEKNGNMQIIEKTCANALRINFVRRVFPEAFFIHIIRDGRSVAESARRRWLAAPELSYLIEKLRWMPLFEAPLYGIKYLSYQIGRFQNNNKGQLSWGPRFFGLDTMVKEKTLIEVCGLQWMKCVNAAEAALKVLPEDKNITVRYEDIVTEPVKTTAKIFDRLKIGFLPECQEYVARQIQKDKIDKWKRCLSHEDVMLLWGSIKDTLLKYGYNDKMIFS